MELILKVELSGKLTLYNKSLHDKSGLPDEIEFSANNYLKDIDYGTGVKVYVFIHKLHELVLDHPYANVEEVVYQKRKKYFWYAPALRNESELDFYLHSTEKEWHSHVAKLVLNGILKMKEKGVKDFDTSRFYEDLENFFKSKGVL